MKQLVILLLLCCSQLQAQYTFSRAELEAAADSALYGQQASENEKKLGRAVDVLMRMASKSSIAQAYCDSINDVQAKKISLVLSDTEQKEKRIAELNQKIAKNKPWAFIGKTAVAIVAVATIAAAVVVVKKEIE